MLKILNITKPEMLKHKKFQAGIIATLVLLLAQLGPALEISPTFWTAVGSISPTEWFLIIGPILTAIGFQGVADIGKEAAKINNDKPLALEYDSDLFEELDKEAK